MKMIKNFAKYLPHAIDAMYYSASVYPSGCNDKLRVDIGGVVLKFKKRR